MPRLLIGPGSLALLLFASGCATSAREPVTVPVAMVPEVPSFLVRPLPAPTRQVTRNRDLLQLLADYESLRRRANADRAAVADLLDQPGSAGEK
ncbi:hypothetical protein FIU83_06375 [Halomonas sp. THAF5a]|nr:hypothetical protein FIU83_06375 [Halomonas sp. THAF5a]